ncbi:MAG: hypothetical protein COV44_11675 [Deltaproteobacteria bacterium CG11_big_fil_rev_8_21_14_0_20_45_16]|nr:MAG: hypothetical protein COV44_11675 [Deltaproteobacteria bacterium CG11_big_fil_rev_8_21_14_0_20_45_16]
MASDDGNKKDWREIDQMRVRGNRPASNKSKSGLEKRADALASKEARNDLEKLFAGGKLTMAKADRLKAIREARSTPAYYEKMSEYIREFGIPLDWETQRLFLDHRDNKVVVQLLEQLQKTAGTMPLDQQSLLVQKLKVMEVASFDPDLVKRIRELKSFLHS